MVAFWEPSIIENAAVDDLKEVAEHIGASEHTVIAANIVAVKRNQKHNRKP